MKKSLCFSTVIMLAAVLAYAGTITVTQPAAGNVAMGSHVEITWTAVGVAANVRIQLRRPGGVLVATLAGNVPLTPGSFNWIVAAPAVIGETYRIHVHSLEGPAEGTSGLITVVAASGSPGKSGTFGKSEDPVMQNKNALRDKLKSLKLPDLIPSCTANIGKVNAVSSFSLGLKNMGDIPYDRPTCDWIKFYYWGVNGTTIPKSIFDMVKTNLPYPIPGGGTHSHVVQYTFTQKGKYTYHVYVNPPECQDQHGNEPDCNLGNNGLTQKVFWIE
ncbi:MAG: hypothetical protein JXO51_11335 [Candidatus Aminicenantes bacterium]|nr:hypothetical protein [Candidatus Aminicenantes bacterium]